MTAPRPWSSHEDSLLRQAVAEHGDEQAAWKTIADCVPGRSNKACRKRWLHSLSPTIRKTPWTPAEDALLLKLYATHSPPRWSLIAKSIPGRTDDACSKRYREALDPLLKKDSWTTEEDVKLVHLTEQLGSKWTQVGQAMGRSGLGCRNRWRLLERKQRSRNFSIQEAADNLMIRPHDEYHLPDYSANTASSIPYHTGSTEQLHTSLDAAFSDTLPGTASLVHHPLPCSISTDSSLSGALTAPFAPPSTRDNPPNPFTSVSVNSSFISTPQSPPTHDHFEFSRPSPPSLQLNPQLSRPDSDDPIVDPGPCPTAVPSSPPEHPGADPGSAALGAAAVSSVDPSAVAASSADSSAAAPSSAALGQTVPDEISSSLPPRKRPRLSGPTTGLSEHSRLSSHLPADVDRAVLPYACGHPVCWPGSTGHGAACFATASELAEHRRQAHPEDENRNQGGKLFRCALQGCGKGWKNINGIQYHLQLSKAHFKLALSQARGPYAAPAPSEVTETNYNSPEESKAGTTTRKRKEHRCPHEGCMNSYKQRSGLQYHLAHGHPANVAQLDAIPPALMRKLVAAPAAPED